VITCPSSRKLISQLAKRGVFECRARGCGRRFRFAEEPRTPGDPSVPAATASSAETKFRRAPIVAGGGMSDDRRLGPFRDERNNGGGACLKVLT